MAETAIAAVLSKFGELAASEAKILLEVGDDMTLLRDRLEWLQAFIRDADRKRRAGTDQLTRVWVHQSRDVAFEAEDMLDEIVYQEERRSQGYRCWKKIWRKYLTGLCTEIVSRRVLSDRIKSINKRLAKISENQKEYNIGHIPLAPATSSATTATSAWSNDAVGLDDKVETLSQVLLGDDPLWQMFISVVGESGIGKTTFVSMIWKKMFETHNHVFKVIIWCIVSADHTVDALLEQIYIRIIDFCKKKGVATDVHHQPKEEDNDVSTTDKIRHLLTRKRYLVIISGISSKAMFNCVRTSLPDDNNGSRVLLVLDTEGEEVAWHANAMNKEGVNRIYMLGCLDEKTSWQLFYSRAFRLEVVLYGGGGSEWMEQWENNVGKIVYDITGGYPLAIVVVAGLLRFKDIHGLWEAVLQQLRPTGPGTIIQGGNYLLQNQQQQQIIEAAAQSTRTTPIERVFWTSFEDLPNELKSCFLYFAAFPKNTSCVANEVVRMWMAEGFIKPQKGKTMEELGHSYLKELILRCLVHIGQMDITGRIGLVYVHPRLHGFLQSEAREAGFMEVHDMHHHAFVPRSARRLSFSNLGGGYTTFTNKFPKLRSFSMYLVEEGRRRRLPRRRGNGSAGDSQQQGWQHDVRFLCGSKFLRVITMVGVGLRIQELPNEIGELIHLRYLKVQAKDLKGLPSSIKRLLNLQTLDIRGTQVEKIDPGFWKIRTLRHVLADNLTLPGSIEEDLDDLQALIGVKPYAQGEWKEEDCPLHKMAKLRALVLLGVARDKHGAAFKNALEEMNLLANLKLEADVIPSCVFTAGSLRYLQTVELDGTVEWPDTKWDASKVRPNLVELKLGRTNEVPKHIREEVDKIHQRNIYK